jgi:hypothetical protein
LRKHPQANIGIAAGAGIIVLDIDGPKGAKSLESLGLSFRTGEVRTGRGRHYYFKGTGRTKISLLPGLDLKANGYVVAPPSRHQSGRIYQLKRPLDSLQPVPAKITTLLNEKAGSEERSSGGEIISPGSRNSRLTSIAGSLVRNKLSLTDITVVLGEINRQCCRPPLPRSEVENIARSVFRYSSADEGPCFKDMSSVVPRRVEFLWPPRIPLGFVTLLDGRPGQGKSMLLTSLAAKISLGQKLPFSDSDETGRVLFLSVEDPPEEVMRPRLERANADLDQIRFASKPFILNSEGLDHLEAELEKTKPRLVVIDPLFAYLGEKTDAHRANEVMPFMYRLAHLARRHRSAIVGVRHLTKAAHEDVLNAGIGSIGFVGAARSALLLAPHPDHEDLLVLAHTKHNLSKGAPAIVFERIDGTPITPPRLKFLREEDIDPGRLVRFDKQEVGRPHDERDEAVSFLREYLKSGPKPSRQVFNAAETRNISTKTLRRALAEAGGRVEGKGPAAKWRLGQK